MEPAKMRNHQCDTKGLFLNEEQQPDPKIVSNLCMHFNELPEWMVSAAVMFDLKNPNWRASHERDEEKPILFQTKPEWWGETPEERIKRGKPERTEEEALAYANDGNKAKVSSEAVCRAVGVEENKIEQIVSVI